MIDSEIKVEKRETQEFEPLPENVYQVELLDVNSSENETYNSKMGKTEEKEYETILSFQYTLLAGKGKDNAELRGRNVWDNFVPSYLYVSSKNGKNKLYRIIESLLGRELTPEEEAGGIDSAFLNNLVGKQMRIATENQEKGEKIYTKVKTYYAIDAELDSLTDEEKANSTVKPKEDSPQVGTDEISGDEITKAFEDDKVESPF